MRRISHRKDEPKRKAVAAKAPLKRSSHLKTFPTKDATYAELDRFFDRHSAPELVRAGLTEVDPHPNELLEKLRLHTKQPNMA